MAAGMARPARPSSAPPKLRRAPPTANARVRAAVTSAVELKAARRFQAQLSAAPTCFMASLKPSAAPWPRLKAYCRAHPPATTLTKPVAANPKIRPSAGKRSMRAPTLPVSLARPLTPQFTLGSSVPAKALPRAVTFWVSMVHCPPALSRKRW